MNHEIDDLVDGAHMKAQRIAWIDHLKRMNESWGVKKICKWRPGGRITKGRPRKW